MERTLEIMIDELKMAKEEYKFLRKLTNNASRRVNKLRKEIKKI